MSQREEVAVMRAPVFLLKLAIGCKLYILTGNTSIVFFCIRSDLDFAKY